MENTVQFGCTVDAPAIQELMREGNLRAKWKNSKKCDQKHTMELPELKLPCAIAAFPLCPISDLPRNSHDRNPVAPMLCPTLVFLEQVKPQQTSLSSSTAAFQAWRRKSRQEFSNPH